MIKAVIFDMDGLLIDSEPLWEQAFKDAFEPEGVKVTTEDMLQVRGRRQLESIDYFARTYNWQGSHKAMEATINEDMIGQIKSMGELMPGAEQALKICRDAGLPLTIASSSSYEVIKTVLEKCGIGDFFKLVHSGTDEPYGKPHPGIFITTAKLLGIKPHDCLVFEDAPSGVIAAKAAHMTCIAVPEPAHRDHAYIKTADIALDSLEQFNAAMLQNIPD